MRRERPISGFRFVRCAGCGVWRLAGEGYAPPHPSPPGDEDESVRWFTVTVLELESRAPRGRLLDVGSGAGHLLEAARRRGWDVTGVELDEDSAEQSRRLYGLDPIVAPFALGLVGDETFDAVTFHHSLEHFADPVEALAAARAALRPGGVLHVVVPNLRTVDRLWSRKIRRRIWDPPRHRFVFTDRTLRALVERAGFAVETCRPQVSRLLQPLVARRVAAGAPPVSAAARDRSRRATLLRAAAGVARTVAPGAAVRLYAVKPG